MKIRNGWVSNSSSSSFIIGIAEVVNEEGLRKFLEDSKVDPYRYKIGSVGDFNEWDDIRVRYDRLTVVAPINDEPEISVKADLTKTYFVVCLGNNEGDWAFETGDWSLNYDKVNYDWFDTDQQKLLDLLYNKHPEIVKGLAVEIGAGRNG